MPNEFENDGDAKTLEGVTVTGFLKKHKGTLAVVAVAAIVLVSIYFITKAKTIQ